jgi:hypothetical protein
MQVREEVVKRAVKDGVHGVDYAVTESRPIVQSSMATGRWSPQGVSRAALLR